MLPKVDSRQFFSFIRHKFNGASFPIVALSGTIIEQLGTLEDIGADFYIAKGPIDKLEYQLNEFITRIEKQPKRFFKLAADPKNRVISGQ